jgi:DUF4097 and DUF4098 domain-containing protein YvlB
MKLSLLTLAMIAGLSAPAWAAKPVDQTRALDPRGSVRVENIKGRIEVRVWDRPEVHIGGSLGDGVERLAIDGGRDRLDIEVKYPRNSRDSEPTTLLLKVPVLASLDIDGVAVDIDVLGTAGATLGIDSVSGSVVVAGAPGRADIESVSGRVNATLNSRNVSVQSVSGDIKLRGRLKGEVEAETVSGDLLVDTRGERVRRVSASSVSGDMNIRGALAEGGRIGTETVSGRIVITMPRSLSARVSGESFSGDLDAPGAHVNRAKYGPGSDFEHRYGDGSGEIRMETFSGDAELRLE